MKYVTGVDCIGHKVKDVVTGFSGTITGYCTYITGCNQALVMPESKDGKPAEGQWADEQRLQYLSNEAEPIKLNNTKSPGFDKAPPVR